MIYPKDFENKIGFALLRNALIEKCESDMGKRLAEQMSFKSDRKLLIKELGATSEMKNLIQ